MKLFISLRTKLSLWYIGTIVSLAIFFYVFVHFLAIPYSTELFLVLLLVLALIGYFIIYKITSSLTYVAWEMKQITSKNLDRRLEGITSQDEIGELAQSFNSLLDRLNEAFQREQQFIADVAHELKTPLSTLRTTLELGNNRKRSQGEYCDVIEDALVETNQISTTLKNILDLAWMETPVDRTKLKSVDLSGLMHELKDIAEKMAVAKHITIHTKITSHITVSGFKDKLGRAILNIIDNALKYTPDHGTVWLTLEKAGHHAVISIKDSGQGIAEQDLRHIFDRFYRGASTAKVLGSGLGLAISKSTIVMHRGFIKAESSIGHGSTFIINLPLV